MCKFNNLNVKMQTKDIWNAIEDIYLTFGGQSIETDSKLIAEKTGLPYKLVKDVIKTELLKQKKGGEKTNG